MSQFYVNVSDSNIPPDVPTAFTTDVRDDTTTGPGTAVPSGNVIEILGGQTDQNNSNGIRTDADPNNGNIVYVELTNRIQASLTTTNETPTTLFSFDLGASGATYTFELLFSVYDRTNNKGASYQVLASIRTDGVSGTGIGSSTPLNMEDAELNPSSLGVNVVGNALVATATGIAATTINWQIVGYYVKAL